MKKNKAEYEKWDKMAEQRRLDLERLEHERNNKKRAVSGWIPNDNTTLHIKQHLAFFIEWLFN